MAKSKLDNHIKQTKDMLGKLIEVNAELRNNLDFVLGKVVILEKKVADIEYKAQLDSRS